MFKTYCRVKIFVHLRAYFLLFPFLPQIRFQIIQVKTCTHGRIKFSDFILWNKFGAFENWSITLFPEGPYWSDISWACKIHLELKNLEKAAKRWVHPSALGVSWKISWNLMFCFGIEDFCKTTHTLLSKNYKKWPCFKFPAPCLVWMVYEHVVSAPGGKLHPPTEVPWW